MGRAIARRPKAFLMDEPLSNLDARLRGHMRSEIAALQEMTGVTTVYVTHDQIEAMTMGDRVAVMRNGALQQLGPPRELYDRPANVFVAGFIGAPTMNFLRVDLIAEEGGATAVAEGFRLKLPTELVAAKPKLAAYLGRQVMLGLRPEALSRADDGGALAGDVAFVEDFGATQLAHLDIGVRLSDIAIEPDEMPAAPRLRALIDATTPHPRRRAAAARHRRRAASISSIPRPNMRSEAVVGLDIGTTSTVAVVMRAGWRGAGLGLAARRGCSRPSPASPRPIPPNGGTTPARLCARRSQRPGVAPAGICVTGMLPAVVLLDEARPPAAPQPATERRALRGRA